MLCLCCGVCIIIIIIINSLVGCGWLAGAGFEKMLMYFDPSKKTINVDDVRLLFRKLDKTSSGSGGGKAAAAGEQPGTVSLSAVRAFFGSDC